MKRLSHNQIRPPRGAGGWRSLRRNLHALSLATLGVVVFVLAVLQYRWIDEVSEAQESRLRSRLRDDLRLIGDAFDVEITRAVLAFTVPRAPWEPMNDQLEQAWLTWNRDAPWPRVVSGIWYLEAEDNGWRTQSWGTTGTVDPLSVLRAEDLAEPSREVRRGADSVTVEARMRPLFVNGQPSVLWPLPAFSERSASLRVNWILISYDLGYLTDHFFPRLLERYSSAEVRKDFQFATRPGSAVDAGTVLTADQFHYRPDCLMSLVRGEPARSVSGAISSRNVPGKSVGGVPTGANRLSVGHELLHNPFLNSFLHAEGACRAAPSPADRGLMQVSVRRQPATLSDVFTGFRQRNLFVSGVVMTVLLAGLIALVVSTERARRLARLQTVIAGGISHELRSPLASLSVTADHLQNGHVQTADQARQYGEIIDAQSRRLRHVVEQALTLTGLTQPNGPSEYHAVSISQVIQAACDAFEAQAREMGIEIESHAASDVPLVAADPDVLLRCLTNLIENSIKYAGSGGWIRISAQRAHHARRSVVEVTVEDRGPGVEDDERTNVFEPFFRGSSARRSRQPGSGLGLSIVKSGVEAYGGWITLERSPAHGCKFRLFFLAANDVDVVHSKRSEV
jgi:signal transduction histidine kinase